MTGDNYRAGGVTMVKAFGHVHGNGTLDCWACGTPYERIRDFGISCGLTPEEKWAAIIDKVTETWNRGHANNIPDWPNLQDYLSRWKGHCWGIYD